MIGRLRGTLIEKQPPWLVVDVGGVGYELEASMNTLLALPGLGETVQLFTHLSIREDAHLLYGFHKEPERALFRALIKVNGVGPKLALAILSGMEQEQFIRCVMEDDVKALTRLPGVGKKTAERLIVEMRDRFPHWSAETQGELTSLPPGVPATSDPLADAEAALISLGYKPAEASRMLSGLEANQSTEALIKSALSRKLAG
ncbi:Holliday junction branch migration protein RuvA [Halomonas sp. McH1-25]|uniref:Holliday junction branch migration protein RuvA n=1 Tax=unclassified Halomonas TaxID=2609666 RepID=UPI001EF6A0B7|nr:MULTISPECIES: Holliday junction branch migration protein RuvA [unclassified Halomonas]MCG7598501.1 Holliday junction branch migration protein RuvA [Halomonas sp. McH1-25]MCP1341753.1 Holliday junction branch migration protein RuvA [Halomonas sp. FL8]MCP1361918.1 Holliday junction branch migration protein RuvA [Halomonas sp. BBD45]MCP1365422.1 Holliday junction branch migration protein RuvA [Halomonas sp. BBD48]